MSILKSEFARAFKPLMSPARRYLGAWGGRGSGKSYHFGERLIWECIRQPGTSGLCVRQYQRTLAESSKKIVEDSIAKLKVDELFNITKDNIRTPGGGRIIFVGMQDHTKESIKSLEGFRIAWIDEAHMLTEQSLDMLRATMFRVPESQICASWNPTRKLDAIDRFFRVNPPDDAISVKVNWEDNPWFPGDLDKEREHDLKTSPEWYLHKWEGEYASAFVGAYFAAGLGEAKAQGRIGRVARDPLLPLRAYWDLGGAGATADAMAIWITQFVGQEIRVLDFIEGVGQTLSYYTDELRARGYERAVCHLPHDGVNTNNLTGKQYWQHLSEAGFDVPPPASNLGSGAASMRVEAVRRLLPKCWFNDDTTEPGRQALGFYHEKKHEKLGHGLGPEHDWSSHAADAFGLMAISYEEPSRAKAFGRKLDFSRMGKVV